AERDAELADRSRAEYATVTLEARLMASEGRSVALDLAGAGRVTGELRRVGSGWCLVTGVGRDWLVPTGSVEAAAGLSDRAVPEVAWSAVARLGLSSALRRLADEGVPCVLLTRTGTRYDGVLLRVGQDFVETQSDGERPQRVLVALRSIAAVQSRQD
ncbi:MAG: hypothetical protein ABIO16_11270, partial [Nocardioides sp.]